MKITIVQTSPAAMLVVDVPPMIPFTVRTTHGGLLKLIRNHSNQIVSLESMTLWDMDTLGDAKVEHLYRDHELILRG